ncbi:hypothetical protein QWY86_05210 [Pedobacter aquatilis]|uniref:hypothetical protein n=1 Tax=Pedobacter aquatilis TaxID=351343 RepID=UPI0025B28FD2|nr:hypothetical protein [Pedobacter aquatilis]MDN3586054.1 hypothetical protein [Pedobacter aquatilis]
MKTNQNFLKSASSSANLSAVETYAPALANAFKWAMKPILAADRHITIQEDKSRILLKDIFMLNNLKYRYETIMIFQPQKPMNKIMIAS